MLSVHSGPIREFKLRNPDTEIDIVTEHPEVFKNNTDINLISTEDNNI
jgi:hypothetical protein